MARSDKPMRHFRTLFAVLVVTLLLAACTTTFMYRNLDWLIPWYVNGVVDITRDQKAELKTYLEPFLRWHREEELQRYADLLDRAQARVREPVDAATVQGWFDDGVAAIERVEERMLELSIQFGESLSDEQMREFREALWEQQEELEEEYLPREDGKWKEDSLEYLTEFIEEFIGRLEPEQQSRIQAAADDLVRFDQLWLEDRENWLKRIDPLLERPEGWQQAMRAAYAERADMQSTEFQETFDHNVQVFAEATADVLNSMTPKQRQRLNDEIDKWQRKLQKMMNSADDD